MKNFSKRRVALALLLACSCEQQHYVSADTVELLVTDADDAPRVNRCHYVPVLLGSEIRARYVVAGDAKATLTINRDEVVVSFEGFETQPPPFRVATSALDDPDSGVAPEPPDGYRVTLGLGCTPDD